MPLTQKCPQCGAELAADTAQGLCPACLLKHAMATATKDGAAHVEPPDTQTLNPELGTKVQYFGDYELLNEIARGGMGVIYKARQSSLNRIVALKMIRSGELASEAEVKRFHTEAEAAANLQHPNIVAIHEVGIHEGRHYFTMDFVEGQDLARVIGGQPLPAQRAAQYAKTIAEAIHFAHQRGTLHRDLKPQNVMIDTADRVRITDFGLAKQLHRDSSLTMTGAVMGSPNYMSPEQAQGRGDLIGPATDVYSLGAILYELLTGRPPFVADSPAATMLKVIEQDPTAPSKLNPNVPADLETICLKCLEKSPQRRYPAAQALAEDLGRFLKQEPILARPVSKARKAEQWAKRNPLVLAGIAALAFLGVSSVAYGLWQQNQYLVWHVAHPDVARAAGARTAFAEALYQASIFLSVPMMWALLLFNKKIRGVPVSKLFDAKWRLSQPKTPMSPRAMAFYEIIAIGSIVFGLYDLAKLTDAWVWEAYFKPAAYMQIYLLTYFGVMILWSVWRQRRTELFGCVGVDPERLPPELVDQIVAALRAADSVEAFKLYRQATQCTLVEATTAVAGIAQKHGVAVLPAKFNPKWLLAGLLISAAVVGGVSFFVPLDWRWPLLAQFGGGCVAGLVFIFGGRLKGKWMPALAIILGIVLLILVGRPFRPNHSSILIPVVGWLAGTTLALKSYRKPIAVGR